MLRFYLGWLSAIGGLQCVQITLDALLDLLLTSCNLVGREVVVAAVDRLELATVDGYDRLCKQLQPPAYHHEATAHVANALTIVPPELGNRLEVWRKPAGQPH